MKSYIILILNLCFFAKCSAITPEFETALDLKHKAESFAEQNSREGFLQAFAVLDSLVLESDLLEDLGDPLEIYYLRALVLSKAAEMDDENQYNPAVENSLVTHLENYKTSKFADLSLNLLGTLYHKNHEFEKASKTFLKLVNDYPNSKLVPEALFKAVLSLEQFSSNIEEIKKLKKKIFTEYPEFEKAAESYFSYYSYQDYIEGEGQALEHLHSFMKLFPKSPFLLNAHYLLGMDYKRDRKTLEGKWIRKKNLNLAIDHFQLVESHFDELYKENLLNEDLDYFLTLRYLSRLERALTNLKIAEESQGAKEKIYLEYAQAGFLEIIEDFKNPKQPFLKLFVGQESYPHFLEESSYWLGTACLKAKNSVQAKKVFLEMLDHYQASTITRGFFLSRVFYELGSISMKEENYLLSLSYFMKAEDAAKGKILNREQKLDLWIQQSLCHLGLKQFDQAILTLSKVINDDAISGQRLKAMFLRAEIYELQGRFDLSKKHFEATAKKGGEWALKAKLKLEKDYGY